MLLFRGLLASSRANAFPVALAHEADSDHGKELTGNMNDYEILLMLDPEAPEERHNEIIERTRQAIEKGGGNWLSHDAWGRRRLAYEIDHKTDGVYHLLQFDSKPETLDEVTRVLKITDGVMRHMATRRPKGGGRVAAPPPLPPSEGARERVPAPAEAAPTPTEPADSEGLAEEYAEPTASEAPEAAPEEES
jgi:small subunit ribosomal protein S6